MKRARFDIILEVLGAVITCGGVWMLYAPASVILAGIYIIYVSQGIRR
tara:strand:+ start:79 stop:222 length:144 start_codon:yes stop_codon:yes gene_type:complete